MRLLRFVRSAYPEANALGAASAAGLLIKLLVLNELPEAFDGAYELGVVAESIMVSVLASYVFYLLVVHAKEASDRAILKPYVEKHSRTVVGRCKAQLADLSQASTRPLLLSGVTAEEIAESFSHIAPTAKAPLLLLVDPPMHANWLQYFGEHAQRSKESIRKLFDQLPFLDAELVKILTEIDDCSHLNHQSYHSPFDARNRDLSAWAGGFYRYCVSCRELEGKIEK
jgi:alkylhydroperoxidase/carboxymuconolactone decarboxylase family protein YurZ